MEYIDDKSRELMAALRSVEGDLATVWREAARALSNAIRLTGIKAEEPEASLLNLGRADPMRELWKETNNWRKMHGLPMRRRRAGRKRGVRKCRNSRKDN